MTARHVSIGAAFLLAVVPVAAQAPTEGAATPQTAAVPALEPHGYTYDPAGRRDPFISLVRRTAEAQGRSSNPRPPGLAGMSVADIALKGIVRGPNGFVAMAKGPDNKTYYIKSGDRLYDGTVRAIAQDAMYVVQNVTDPLSSVKQREIRKPLRTLEAQ